MLRGIEITKETELQVSKNTLILGAVLGSIHESTRTTLSIQYKNGECGQLCSLIPGVVENTSMNLIIRPGERFTLTTSNTNSVYLNYSEEGREESPDYYTGPVSLSIIRIRPNEKVLLTGSINYTTCTLVSGTTERVSLCVMVSGREVTLANLVKDKIESVELSLELLEEEELELFLVGDGEVDLIGYITQEEEDTSDNCSDCGGYGVECTCEWEDSTTEESQEESQEEVQNEVQQLPSTQRVFRINDSEYIGEQVFDDPRYNSPYGYKENTQMLVDMPPSPVLRQISKEEKKRQQKEKDLKDIAVVDVLKSKIKNAMTAKKNDKVRIRYTLYLQDKVVDKTNHSGVAFTMGDGQMIKGLELGIEGMTVGSKRTITVPPHLAYGDKRMGSIPPNSTLVFSVELCAIDKK